MLPDCVAANFSPEPILSAADSYRGQIVDLDAARVVGAAELARARQQLAAALPRSGLAAGDRVIVALGNGPLFVAALAAILDRGGCPLLVHFKTPPAELRRTGLRFGAPLVITDECPLDAMQAEFPTCAELVSSGPDWVRARCARLSESDPAFQASQPWLPGVPLHPTSGTTGVPKVAARPGYRATEEARHYIETIGISAEDTILAVPPMSHAYAFGMCVMVPLLSGARVVTLRGFSQKKVFQELVAGRLTIFPAVPAMLDLLLFGAGDRLRGACRTVLTAGAPLPLRTARQFRQAWGIAVRPLYGTTETGGIAVAEEPEEELPVGCVGRPMHGVEVQVRPAADHAGLGDNVGMLYVRSSSMMEGYVGPDGVDPSPLADGWFQTGDVARIDAAGAIHLKGRETEVINVGGMKVLPGEVEEVIATLPGVREVKVYAGSKRSVAQLVKAAVVTDGSVDVRAIQAHCQHHLVYYKRPARIALLDALPRSAAGKILPDQLP